MLKYISTALALKCFGSTSGTRAFYRALGNRVGGRRRSTGAMPGYYPERLKRMLRLQREHSILQPGDRILELGTGWLHWEALTLRLFFDIEATLYDVWDNRQLGGLKNYVRQLGPMLANGFELKPSQRDRAQALIGQILRVESFEELYALLNFQYVVESSGSLARFGDGSFQLVVSAGVLEHVDRQAIAHLIPETRRILKPGGWAVHSIDTSDHLAHYDNKISKKLYLGFSESTWRRLCQNGVQYINRVQRGEWLEIFKAAGFELIDEDSRQVDISRIKLAERYRTMNQQDLASTVVRLAYRACEPIAPVASEKLRLICS